MSFVPNPGARTRRRPEKPFWTIGASRRPLLSTRLLAPALFAVLASLLPVPPSTAEPGPSRERLAPGLGVDEIVTRHLHAIGGDRRLAVRSLVRRGHVAFRGARSPIEVYHRRPSDYRETLVRGDRSRVLSFDGDEAWVHSGFPPYPARLPPSTAAFLRDELSDFDGALVDFRLKGHEVELLGNDEVDGTPVFHLRVTLASGTEQEWFLDQESFLVVKKTTPASHPERGEYRRAYYYQSYRNHGGFLLPDYVEREDQERVRAFEWTETEVNVRLDDSLFTGVSLPADQPTRGEQ